MKLIITGSAILASVANAGLSTISEDLGLLVAQNSSMWDDRSITAMLGNMGSVIDTYGCWCYFDEKHGQGKGHPVNSIDKICRDMAHGYDCAIMDAAADGDNDCVPWEVNYVGGSGQGLDNLVANQGFLRCWDWFAGIAGFLVCWPVLVTSNPSKKTSKCMKFWKLSFKINIFSTFWF